MVAFMAPELEHISVYAFILTYLLTLHKISISSSI